MSDIDFDELDKAVSSLMDSEGVATPKTGAAASSVATATPAAAQPAETVAAVQPAAAPAPSSPPAVAPESETATSARSVPSLAIKRRGQFMDVMHPSADMKTTNRAARAVATTSRQGVTLSPVNKVAKPVDEESPSSADAPQAAESVEPPANAAPPATTTDALSFAGVAAPVWPDPIDVAAEQQGGAAGIIVSESAASPSADETTMSTSPSEADTMPNEPLSSPFIPGAKVEKRPLGQAQPTGLSEAAEPVEEATEAVEESSQPVQGEVTLPTELSGDVLAVESNELHAEEVKPGEAVAPAVPPQAEVVSAPVVDGNDAPEAPAEPAAAQSPEPASIPPQYKATAEEPAEHAALYDTATAAQVAVPSKKKKNGWLIPVAIVALILLGCGGGVLAYYYMM